MPQATPELRAKFPDGDTQALREIAENFTVSRDGVIRKRDGDYSPSSREWDAVDYLFHEWDYTYEEN